MLPYSKMVCTCCQLHCIPRSCCYLTALNPQAVSHLLEGNRVHYLRAISTGGSQPELLHANRKQTSFQRIQAQKKHTHYLHLYRYVCISTQTRYVSYTNCQFMCCCFFNSNFGFEWILVMTRCMYNELCKYSARVKTHQKPSYRGPPWQQLLLHNVPLNWLNLLD